MDKKGVFNLEVAKSVLVTVLLLAIVAIAMFLVLVPLLSTESSIEDNRASLNDYQITTVVNNTATYSLGLTALDCQIISATVVNGSTNYAISSGNYSFSGCNLVPNTVITSNPLVNNTLWNISAAVYSYDNPYATNIVNNVTYGTTNFFTYIPTVFIILGIVVVIGVIASVIYAVYIFSGKNMELGGL